MSSHHFLWFAAVAMACLSAGTAVGSPDGCLTTSRPDDGARAAPRGRPQFPALLNGYALRPPWRVAGVDYCVGYPADATLKDPQAISMDGVEVDRSGHTIRIVRSDVVLDGYDFSAHGGYSVGVIGAARVTIRNSKFQVGRQQTTIPIQSDAASPDLIVSHNVVDGGGIQGGRTGDPGAIWSLIQAQGRNLTVEYNWLRNAPQHIVETTDGRLIYRFNLIDTVGFATGAHPNGVQFTEGIHEGSVIAFNTFFSPQPIGAFPLGLGEPIQVEAQLGSTIRQTDVGYNTIVTTGPRKTASYTIAFRQDRFDRGPNVNQGGCVHDNYIDPIGAYGPFYPRSGGAREIHYFNNQNMRAGAPFSNAP